MSTIYKNASIVTSGLILYLDAANSNSYPGTGTTWYDLSQSVQNGELISGSIYSNVNGGVIVFDGTNDYVASSLNVNSITNVTIQCWVNISSTSKKGTFVKVGGGANGYSIGVGLNTADVLGNEILGLFPGIRWIDPNKTYGTGWKMVTMTLSATSVPTIYVNTTLIGSYPGTVPIDPTAGVYIGRNIGDEPSGARAYAGNIANTLIYNKVLSLSEIQQNYNALRTRFNL